MSGKLRFTALCLVLLTCLSVFAPALTLAACAEHTYTETVTAPATSEADGTVTYTCSACGDIKTERIPAIGSVTLRTTAASFKDKAQFPEVYVKDADGNDISSEYYTLSMETASGASVPYAIKIGKYYVIVTFSGRYSGEVKLSFKVVPVAVENLSVSASSDGTVSISYDAVDGAKGYQIYYSKHKHGPYKRIATTSKTSYTYKVAPGRTYYFKVRAYKSTSNGNVFGKYSSIRSVSVK